MILYLTLGFVPFFFQTQTIPTDPGFVWLGRCMAGAEAQAQQRSLRRPATLRIRVRVLLLATTCAEVSRRSSNL